MVELLIVMVILPLLVGGVTEAIISSMDNSTTIYSRVADSSDTQITSSFFVRDVENASNIQTSTGQAPLCAPSGVTGQILGLGWTDASGNQVDVSYVYNAGSAQLIRYSCVTKATSVSTAIVAHDLSAPPVVDISCYPTIPLSECPSSTGQYITGSVSSVSLSLTEAGAGNPYSSQVVASPRVTASGTGGDPSDPGGGTTGSAPGGGGNPVPPVLLLGTGSDDLAIDLAFATVNVDGDAYIDSNAASSVDLSNGLFNTLNASDLNIYDCASTAGVACTNGAVSVPSFLGFPLDTVNGSAVSMGSPLADPIAGLATPPGPSSVAPNCSSGSSQTISGSSQTVTCYPGLYPDGLTISGSKDSITFEPGSYEFGTPGCSGSSCGFNVTGGTNTLTFVGGTGTSTSPFTEMTFNGSDSSDNCSGGNEQTGSPEGGLSITGSSNTLQDSGSGEFFYVAGGQTNLGCGVSTSVNLTGAPVGTYTGLVLWQDAGDDLPVIISGSSSTTTFDGTVYAPSAELEMTGATGAQSFTMGPVVADTMEFGGVFTSVTIGCTSSC